MDENDIVKVGMQIALRPVTEVAENVLGIMGGDWLSEKRARNRARLQSETEKILKESGAKIEDAPSPNVVLPLLGAAQDDGREEMLKLWAALLATAMDPKRRSLYRRDFVEALAKLEPADAILVRALPPSDTPWTNRESIAASLGLSADEVAASLDHLTVTGLLSRVQSPRGYPQWQSTGLGRLLKSALEIPPSSPE